MCINNYVKYYIILKKWSIYWIFIILVNVDYKVNWLIDWLSSLIFLIIEKIYIYVV